MQEKDGTSRPFLRGGRVRPSGGARLPRGVPPFVDQLHDAVGGAGGAQAQTQGLRAEQPQAAPQPQAARPAAPRPPVQPPASRFFMKKFRGTANYVENHTNEFFEEMSRRHPAFQVVSTTAVELPDSICLFLTYSI